MLDGGAVESVGLHVTESEALSPAVAAKAEWREGANMGQQRIVIHAVRLPVAPAVSGPRRRSRGPRVGDGQRSVRNRSTSSASKSNRGPATIPVVYGFTIM